MNIHHTEDVAQLRRAAYPPLEDLADAMFWASRGDPSKLASYHAKIAAVKAMYPKTAPPD